MKTLPSAFLVRRSVKVGAVPLLLALLCAVSLAAQDVKLPLKTIQVKPFTQAEGLGLSEEFVNYFNKGLVEFLPKTKVATQVLEDGAEVPADDAANSIVVEGTLVEFKKMGMGGIVGSEISLYRLSDHKLLTTFKAKVPFKRSPLNKDRNVGESTGGRTAFEIQRALKKL